MTCNSQKQTVIALSSAESEYFAMSTCAQQITWLRRILWEIEARRPFDVDDSSCLPPTNLFSDSTAAISLAKSDTVAARNRHTDIKVHHLKELCKRNTISVVYFASRNNVADLLIKIVAYNTLCILSRLLHL